MWYKIDFIKFFVQMLPPVLRSDLLIALIKVIAVPLQYVYNQFVSLKTIAEYHR